jgi:hypothetical protein
MLNHLAYFFTAEWLLLTRPNGGGVVVARAAWTSAWMYVVAAVLWSATHPDTIDQVAWRGVAFAIHGTLPWFGAIFAATYAAYYTRYAGQWTYLSNLYNQMKQVEIQRVDGAFDEEVWLRWCVGFVADAVTLHLDRKKLFQSVVAKYLSDPRVYAAAEETFPENDFRDVMRRHRIVQPAPSQNVPAPAPAPAPEAG